MSVEFPLNPNNLPMGANVAPGGTGVTFRVRPPRAKKVWVRGTFNTGQLTIQRCCTGMATIGSDMSMA